jgi:hypothetical protein
LPFLESTESSGTLFNYLVSRSHLIIGDARVGIAYVWAIKALISLGALRTFGALLSL